MSRKPKNASIEVVSKNGPVNVDTMIKEGVNAMLRTFNNNELWQSEQQNNTIVGQQDSQPINDTREAETADVMQKFTQQLFSTVSQLSGADGSAAASSNAFQIPETAVNTKMGQDILQAMCHLIPGGPSNAKKFMEDFAQQQSSQQQLPQQAFQNLPQLLDNGGVAEAEFIIDYNDGNMDMEKLNETIYEKFTDILNGSAGGQMPVLGWEGTQEEFQETKPASKKKKSKKKKKKNKNKTKITQSNESESRNNDGQSSTNSQTVSSPDNDNLSRNTDQQLEDDVHERSSPSSCGPGCLHSKPAHQNIETKTTINKSDPIDELAALTEAKLRSLLPAEALGNSHSLAKIQDDNTERAPNFSYLAYVDEPLCYFCEYYLVFGELPVNIIKSYYRKASNSSGKQKTSCRDKLAGQDYLMKDVSKGEFASF
ncbi:hypothetical protein ACO0QE_001023 [Hanseniaspora vineae]